MTSLIKKKDMTILNKLKLYISKHGIKKTAYKVLHKILGKKIFNNLKKLKAYLFKYGVKRVAYKLTNIIASKVQIEKLNSIENSTKSAYMLVGIGVLYAAKRQGDASASCFRKAIIKNPKNDLAHYALMYLLRKRGQWWQLVDACKDQLNNKPKNAKLWYRLAFALEMMNRYQEAANAYGQATSNKLFVPAEWYYRQGYCYEREGHDGPANPQAAQIAFKLAVKNDSKHDAKRFGIGVFHQARGHWLQAAQAYHEQLQTDTTDPVLYYKTGMAHDRCYEWSKAALCYEHAVDLAKSNTKSSKELNSSWYFRLGLVYERMGEGWQQKAIDAYQHAIDFSKVNQPEWHYRKAYVLMEMKRLKESAEAFLNYEEVPQLIRPKILTDKDVKEQQEHTKQQLEQDCTDADIWYALGNLLEYEQHWLQAAEAYKQALARQNDHKPQWFYRLGYALNQAKQYQEACEAFRHTRILQKAYGVLESKFNNSPDFRRSATYTEYYEDLKIKPRTVMYESFHGASMSCNPYALFLYLIESEEYKNWTHIWVVNDLSIIPLKYKNKTNIVYIERNSDAYSRYIASAQFLINNVSFPVYFIRKKLQIYLNTWHGTPIKFLGKDIKDDLLAHKNVARNLLQASHVISPNKHTTDILLDRYDVSNVFSGKIAEIGYPRIDRTIKLPVERLNEIRSICNAADKKLVLYAPTWRGEHSKAYIDVEKLKNDLQSLVSEDYAIAFRGHHMLESQLAHLGVNGVTLVPSDIDTNELLGAIDLLITDYSSIAFDFFVTEKPIVYYTYDVEEYFEQRGLYFPIEHLPGTIALTIEEVKSAIQNYLTSVWQYKLGSALEEFCPHEDGNVSAKVWKWLLQNDSKHEITLRNVEKTKLLFYVGPFLPNGILTSWLNLIDLLDKDKFALTLVVDPGSIKASDERILQYEKKPEFIQVLGFVGRFNYNIEEDWLNGKFSAQQKQANNKMYSLLNKAYEREYIRCFGLNSINAAVHFEGYNKNWVSIFSGAPKSLVKNRVIYQHNDKLNEWVYRFPYLEAVFNHYRWYDKLVSVSQQTCELNKQNLREEFQLEENKFCYCDNVQNPEKVLRLSEMTSDLLNNEPFLSNSDKVFITLGRLSVEKDHQKLIKAFVQVVKYQSKVKLLILGDGPLRNELSSLIKDLGLQGVVKLMGRVDNPFPILNKADCFVLSSNHEGQPMVLFEAMILKKPIISTDIVGSRSAIEGRSGHLVENSEAGLAQGMLDFLGGKLTFPEYDITDYQKQALEMFYTKVCGKVL